MALGDIDEYVKQSYIFADVWQARCREVIGPDVAVVSFSSNLQSTFVSGDSENKARALHMKKSKSI